MKSTPLKGDMIDFGLAVSELSLAPGQSRTLRELSYYMTYDPVKRKWGRVSWQNIAHIEQRALRKLRVKLQFHHDPILREAVQTLFKR